MIHLIRKARLGLGAAACMALAACEPASAPVGEPATPTVTRLVAETARNEQLIAETFQQCVAAFPNMRAVRSSLNREGIRAEGAVPNLYIHTANRRTGLFLTNTRKADPRCGFGIKGLRDDEAVSFAGELVQRSFGEAAQPLSMDDRRGIAGWRATAGGEPVLVTVSRNFYVNPYFRGALIVISRDD